MYRDLFPFFSENKLIYFDNAATTQLPDCVITRISDFYRKENTNIARGNYPLSDSVLCEYEETRSKAASFIGAGSSQEIIFTPGCSYSINILANSFARDFIRQNGGKIIVGNLEHNSNYLIWKEISEQLGVELEIFDYQKIPEGRISFAAIAAVPNTVDVDINVKHLTDEVHKRGGLVLVDAAQMAGHKRIDVKALDCDFLVFSAHKMYSATGCGVLYAKKEHMQNFRPFLLGGGIMDGSSYKEAPYCLEVGTPNVASVIAFSAAMDFLNSVGFAAIEKEEAELKNALLTELRKNGDIVLLYPEGNSPVITMNFRNANCSDVSVLLGASDCAVRSGNQCSILAMRTLGISECLRISLAFYNTMQEVECFCARLTKILGFLRN